MEHLKTKDDVFPESQTFPYSDCTASMLPMFWKVEKKTALWMSVSLDEIKGDHTTYRNDNCEVFLASNTTS